MLAGGRAAAQSPSLDDGTPQDDSSSLSAATVLPDASTNPSSVSSAVYVPPSEEEKFHDFAWNALGPVAFAGSAFAAAIDQRFDFPHEWGQGETAYTTRVASNLGIGVVTATAQYSLAEAFHEDTKYYRCTCVGFFPRLWHAAVSTVAAHRGDNGDIEFSIALTASPFIGTMTAANSWIPSRSGAILGIRLGSNNLLGQFVQNEALEFLYGGPHTLLAHIQRRFFKKSYDPDSKT